MNFFKNIKFNYHSKLIPQLIKEQNYDELKGIFQNLFDKDISQFNTLFQKNVFELAQIGKNNFFQNNIVWCNSYLPEDSLLISNFLKSYLDNQKFDKHLFVEYSDSIFETNKLLKIKELTFQQLINNSYFYQYVLSQSSSYHFVNNQGAFFETDSSLMFSHPNLTFAYVYVVRNPFDVISIMNKKNNDLDFTLNQVLNYEQRPEKTFSFDGDQSIELYKHDWAGNVKSWTGENVIESFNGTIINLGDDLKTSFSDLIAHLIHSGMQINLNYQFIDKYVDQNLKQFEIKSEIGLSNNKKKKINRQFLETATKWGFDLN